MFVLFLTVVFAGLGFLLLPWHKKSGLVRYCPPRLSRLSWKGKVNPNSLFPPYDLPCGVVVHFFWVNVETFAGLPFFPFWAALGDDGASWSPLSADCSVFEVRVSDLGRTTLPFFPVHKESVRSFLLCLP